MLSDFTLCTLASLLRQPSGYLLIRHRKESIISCLWGCQIDRIVRLCSFWSGYSYSKFESACDQLAFHRFRDQVRESIRFTVTLLSNFSCMLILEIIITGYYNFPPYIWNYCLLRLKKKLVEKLRIVFVQFLEIFWQESRRERLHCNSADFLCKMILHTICINFWQKNRISSLMKQEPSINRLASDCVTNYHIPRLPSYLF